MQVKSLNFVVDTGRKRLVKRYNPDEGDLDTAPPSDASLRRIYFFTLSCRPALITSFALGHQQFHKLGLMFGGVAGNLTEIGCHASGQQIGTDEMRRAICNRPDWAENMEMWILNTAIFFVRQVEVASVEGVGLGLYLARGIITRQKGYISVKSEIGKGTAFSVCLLN